MKARTVRPGAEPRAEFGKASRGSTIPFFSPSEHFAPSDRHTAGPQGTAPFSQHMSEVGWEPNQTKPEIRSARRGGRASTSPGAANVCARASGHRSPRWWQLLSGVRSTGVGKCWIQASSSIFTSVSTGFWCERIVCLQNRDRQKFCVKRSKGERLHKVILDCFYLLGAILRAS